MEFYGVIVVGFFDLGLWVWSVTGCEWYFVDAFGRIHCLFFQVIKSTMLAIGGDIILPILQRGRGV